MRRTACRRLSPSGRSRCPSGAPFGVARLTSFSTGLNDDGCLLNLPRYLSHPSWPRTSGLQRRISSPWTASCAARRSRASAVKSGLTGLIARLTRLTARRTQAHCQTDALAHGQGSSGAFSGSRGWRTTRPCRLTPTTGPTQTHPPPCLHSLVRVPRCPLASSTISRCRRSRAHQDASAGRSPATR